MYCNAHSTIAKKHCLPDICPASNTFKKMLIRPIKISAKVSNKENFILNILVINPFCTTITAKKGKIICRLTISGQIKTPRKRGFILSFLAKSGQFRALFPFLDWICQVFKEIYLTGVYIVHPSNNPNFSR